MDIMSFIPSQRQAILERFQQVEPWGLGAVRDEVANLLASSMKCFILGEGIFLIKQWYPSAFSMKRTWNLFLWMS